MDIQLHNANIFNIVLTRNPTLSYSPPSKVLCHLYEAATGTLTGVDFFFQPMLILMLIITHCPPI